MRYIIAAILISTMLVVFPGTILGQGPNTRGPSTEDPQRKPTPSPREEDPAARTAASEGGGQAVGKGISTKTIVGVIAAGATAVVVGLASASDQEGHGHGD